MGVRWEFDSEGKLHFYKTDNNSTFHMAFSKEDQVGLVAAIKANQE